MSTRVYVGETARVAVACLNASFDTPPITRETDGRWLAPCAPTMWDGPDGPAVLVLSDEDVIDQARLVFRDGLLVVPTGLDFDPDVRP